MSPLGSRVSPAGIVAISKPLNAYTRSRTDTENAEKAGRAGSANASGRMARRPTATNRRRGTSFAIVKALLTPAVLRPRFYSPPVTPRPTAQPAARPPAPDPAAGQKKPR